jgi:hypothetical protein
LLRHLSTLRHLDLAPDGGRTWWAHFEFTRINIAPTILRKKIEELHTLARVCEGAQRLGSTSKKFRIMSFVVIPVVAPRSGLNGS